MDKCVAREDSGNYSSFIFVAKDGHSPCKLESHPQAGALAASNNDTPSLSVRAEDSASTIGSPILSERVEGPASTDNSTLSLSERSDPETFKYAAIRTFRFQDW